MKITSPHQPTKIPSILSSLFPVPCSCSLFFHSDQTAADCHSVRKVEPPPAGNSNVGTTIAPPAATIALSVAFKSESKARPEAPHRRESPPAWPCETRRGRLRSRLQSRCSQPPILEAPAKNGRIKLLRSRHVRRRELNVVDSVVIFCLLMTYLLCVELRGDKERRRA